MDKKKDQSYFLWQVEPKILANVLFPLGEKKKGEVRKVASRLDLHVKDKPDSMGVCFIGEVDVKELLREKLGEKKGEVIYQGEVVGEHDGVWFFTVGQRGGFELDKKRLNKIGVDASSMGALYVLEKDAKRNRVIVGEKSEVYRDVIELGGYNTYIDKNEVVQLAGSGKVFIRVRNLGELVEIKDIKVKDEGMRVILGSKIFGVAEGQSGVLYAGEDGDEEVVGGGIIE